MGARIFLRRMGLLFGLAILTAMTALVAPVLADDTGLVLEDPVREGALIRGRTEPGAVVTIDGERIPVTAQGRFVFGLHRDRDEPVRIAVMLPGQDTRSSTYEVGQRDYDIERIDGLPDRMVTPLGEETLARIREEGARKRAARPEATEVGATEAGETEAGDYRSGFIWPVRGRISGEYGSQRILNGEPRNPHYGVDIAAPTGTPIKAPAGGVVTLAEPDMYFEGGLVFIDHGHGVIGVLMHLDRIDVKVGQRIKQGDIVGTVGATGRATGPHLDWRMYWRKARVDPSLLVPPMSQ